MALVGYNPQSQFGGPALSSGAGYAIHSFIGSLFGQPLVASIEDWMSPGKFTRVIPGSKVINDINIPIHKPGLERYDGQVSFESMSNTWVRVQRGTYKKGTKTNTIRKAEVDFNAWSMAPSTMNVELANNPYLLAAYLLNGAWSGIPQTASGIAVQYPELIATDQIYGGPMALLAPPGTPGSLGGLVAWVTGTNYTGATTAGNGALVVSNGNIYRNLGATATSGATAPSGTTTSSDGTITWTYVMASPTLRQVNPADSSVLTGAGAAGWYNARQNWGISPDNILNTLKNQQQRCAMNGVELALGREGVELWTPYTSEEDFRVLIEVMRELAGSGQLSFSPITVGGSTITFASQPNPVFGRAKVVPVHGMRPDLWCIVSPPPAGHPEYAVFLHAIGGNAGDYAINPDGFDKPDNQNVPHIALYTFDKNSAMFFGVKGVSDFGDIGILALLNEGLATQSALLIDFNYLGTPT